VAVSRPVERTSLAVSSAGERLELAWEAEGRFAAVWTAALLAGPRLEVVLGGSGLQLVTTEQWAVTVASPLQFEAPPSPGTRAVLEEQMENCRQLLELEPGSKWPLLTQARLMRSLDLVRHRSAILAAYAALEVADPLRRGRYTDLAAGLAVETALLAADTEGTDCLDLTGLGVAVPAAVVKDYRQYLARFREVKHLA
jgi:hypothetical protein